MNAFYYRQLMALLLCLRWAIRCQIIRIVHLLMTPVCLLTRLDLLDSSGRAPGVTARTGDRRLKSPLKKRGLLRASHSHAIHVLRCMAPALTFMLQSRSAHYNSTYYVDST